LKARLLTLRKILFRLGILAGLVLLAVQMYQAYLAFKTQVISIQNYLSLGIAALMIVISFLQQIGAWVLLMRSMNIQLPIHKARYIYSLSFLTRYIPGSIWGYLSRSEWLMQDYQVSYTASIYGSVLEVALAILTGLSVIGLSIIITGEIIPIWVGCLLFFSPLLPWLIWFSKLTLPLRQRLTSYLNDDALGFSPRFNDWVKILSLLTLNWLYYGSGVFLVGHALGIWEINQLPSLGIILSGDFSAAWLAGFFVIFIPSGLGIRELVLSSMLVSHFQIAASVAQAISVIMRFTTVLAEFAAILLSSFLYLRFKRKENTKNR